jgi:endonuclease YncB( thermonuclease family)
MHALQRDFEVKIKRVDQKGVYHGTIIIGKRDYAMDLLESGLAVVMNKNANHKYE